jgi:DNA-binding transcriptional regulator YiaG
VCNSRPGENTIRRRRVCACSHRWNTIEVTEPEPDPRSPAARQRDEMRELRLARGMSIPQLAERSGYSVNAIGDYERARGRLPIQALMDIMQVLGPQKNKGERI